MRQFVRKHRGANRNFRRLRTPGSRRHGEFERRSEFFRVLRHAFGRSLGKSGHMQSKGFHSRRAFTLWEVGVIGAIVTAGLALLLPSLQAAREVARRSTCQNHLRQIGVALANYHAVQRTFPIGCRRQRGFGPSWWVGLLPHLGEEELYGAFDMDSDSNGWAVTCAWNGKLIDNVSIDAMRCPASPLPEFNRSGGFRVLLPSYVGIAGATNDALFPEVRINACCVKTGGEISGGGTLIPNAAIRLADIIDGAATTLCVGEISDWVFDPAKQPRHADTGYPNGWIMGTSGEGTPPLFINKQNNVPCWNLTTIKHQPGTTDYILPGINNSATGNNNFGPNNPLLSPHFGGSNGLFVDGSVRFLSNEINLRTLKCLATRDDGLDPGDF